MSLLSSFLVGGAFSTEDDFVELTLSVNMVVPNDQPAINNPFEFNIINRGKLPGFNTSLFKFVMPTDGFYNVQFTARTEGNDTAVGFRCLEILVDGSGNAIGAIAEAKLILSGRTNIYSANASVFYEKDQEIVLGLRQNSGVNKVYTTNGTYVSIVRASIVV